MRRIAIVGGGIAGLTAAYELARLARSGAPVEAVLFEASHRLGGLLETVREGGFTIEGGPDGWVSAKPWARELAIELGLEDELIYSNDATRRTHIFLATPDHPSGRLVAMPDGLNMMVPTDLNALEASPLFTAAAIAAYRAEPARAEELRAAAPAHDESAHDESVADFTLRHFGAEVLARVAAPLLSGVFGGDVRRLSVRAVMPSFVEMERTHGSLVAALQGQMSAQSGQRWRRSAHLHHAALRPRHAGRPPRSGGPCALDPPRHCGDRHSRKHAVCANAPHATTRRPGPCTPPKTGKHYGSETFDAVLLATPLDATRRLLAPLDEAAAQLLPAESSSAVLVAFAYADAARFPLPPGFGFLVPPAYAHPEQAMDPSTSLLLACTFADQKFPNRVPPGGRLVRAFFGGAAATRIANCNNDEVAAIARMELARILQSTAPVSAAPSSLAPPVLTLVRRWPNSLPQYPIGHLDRVAELESRLRTLPGLSGLTILGNALHGVGIPDLVRDARAAARAAHAATDRREL